MSQPHGPVNRKNLRSSRGQHFSYRQPQKLIFFAPTSIFFQLNEDTKNFCQPQFFWTAIFAHLMHTQNETFGGFIFDYAQKQNSNIKHIQPVKIEIVD